VHYPTSRGFVTTSFLIFLEGLATAGVSPAALPAAAPPPSAFPRNGFGRSSSVFLLPLESFGCFADSLAAVRFGLSLAVLVGQT